MGKKKKEVMEKEKGKFLDGAKVKGVDLKIADETFELMSKFAAYGFNKSHSAAYGLVTYQTAYLKHYFPEEFFAGMLSCDKEDTDKVVKHVAEVRAQRHRGACGPTSTCRCRTSRWCASGRRRSFASA